MIRQATMDDVEIISALIANYAQQGLLLPRAVQSICETLLNFRVAELDGKVVGVAALHILGDDLAEIRSLAIEGSAQGMGLGKALVAELFDLAELLRIPRVLALTYQEAFFTRCGFHVIEKGTLRQKIWKDCIHCRKFPICDEIAMIRHTSAATLKNEVADGGVRDQAAGGADAKPEDLFISTRLSALM